MKKLFALLLAGTMLLSGCGGGGEAAENAVEKYLSLIHISEPTRPY